MGAALALGDATSLSRIAPIVWSNLSETNRSGKEDTPNGKVGYASGSSSISRGHERDKSRAPYRLRHDQALQKGRNYLARR
jgi:hypothetical protein